MIEVVVVAIVRRVPDPATRIRIDMRRGRMSRAVGFAIPG
jgi:hypothetical protein